MNPLILYQSAIPEDYTFLNQNTFLSVKAKETVLDLLEKSEKRNPDMFDMYIYNGKLVVA
jgi:hypothetical protein